MRLGFCHSLITQWTIPSLPSTAVTVTFTDTLGKWPRTLGLVRNDIRTCGKQKSKSSTSRWDRSIAETPRDTRPVPLKSYDGQWNPGGSPSLSRQRLTCITIADVSLLDYTVMLRSAWMPAEETRARITPSSWILRCICRLWRSTNVSVWSTHGPSGGNYWPWQSCCHPLKQTWSLVFCRTDADVVCRSEIINTFRQTLFYSI